MCFLRENAINLKAFKRHSNDVWKPFYIVCVRYFFHISFYTLIIAFRFLYRSHFVLPIIGIAEKTYVNVNIHKKENEDKLKQLEQLPDSCAASADCLERQRAVFEQYHVFSPAMVDGVISKLRSYEDRTLRAEIQDSPEEMLKLVEKYFHCG